MKLTILGASAAYPGPGQACSGFLFQEEDVTLLVDCGTGVLSNLQKYVDLVSVSDVVVTHMHADHFIDLIPYRYALKYGAGRRPDRLPRIHLPPAGRNIINRVVSPFSETEDFFSGVFEILEYKPEGNLHLGCLDLRFVPVYHYIPAYAVSVSAPRAGKVMYSSDTGRCSDLLEAARDADILLCNVGRCLEPDVDALWGHTRPADAGALAANAGVKKLLLSHLWPNCSPANVLDQASRVFGRGSELARECQTYHIS